MQEGVNNRASNAKDMEPTGQSVASITCRGSDSSVREEIIAEKCLGIRDA
jgi:hypothetical protein